MKHAWARWVLVVVNGLGALGFGALAMMALSAASDHDIGGSNRAFVILPLLGVGATFGVTAYLQSQRRGRAIQTLIAVVCLCVWLLGISGWLFMYGVFAIISSWWLGDFSTGEEPEPLTGAPEHVARVLWRRGGTPEAIRAELSARNVPADEIEKLVYELVVEEETRQRMSPGR